MHSPGARDQRRHSARSPPWHERIAVGADQQDRDIQFGQPGRQRGARAGLPELRHEHRLAEIPVHRPDHVDHRGVRLARGVDELVEPAVGMPR